jgi:DNA-binding IscR family transcriptional regulator
MSQTGDLETDIMNRLQLNKRGQTIEELSKHLKKTQGVILTVLEELRKENFVAFKDGVWIMVRQ